MDKDMKATRECLERIEKLLYKIYRLGTYMSCFAIGIYLGTIFR